MKHFYTFLFVTLLFLPAGHGELLGQTYEMDTIIYQGDVDYPINLVFLGDGFLESQLQDFRDIADEYANLLFTVYPFQRFKPFFNAFSISTPSNEEGAATDPASLIDNFYGSTFGYAGIDRLLVPTDNARVGTVLADNFPQYDQVFMLVNSSTYGGSGGWVATASLHEDSKDIALHELGHSFSDLADEYWAGAQYAKEAVNMTQETDLDYLRWRNWYGDYEVGLYAHAESPTWYRPHQNCLMRYLGEPFCPVCGEGIIESIYARASPFRGYEPGSTTFDLSEDSVLFKLDLTHPEPTSLERIWYLNQVVIGQGVDSIVVRSGDFTGGSNLVKVTVTDTSSWIRPYNDEDYHRIEVSWTVNTETVGTEQEISLLNHSALSVYPNPVEDRLHVSIPGAQGNEVLVELYDAQGRHVQKAESHDPELLLLEMEGFPAGFYMLRVSLEGKHLSSRIIFKQ